MKCNAAKLHLDSINDVLEPLTFKIDVPPIAADENRAADLASGYIAMREGATHIKIAENGEQVVTTDVHEGVKGLAAQLLDLVRQNMDKGYEAKGELAPETPGPRVEPADRLSLNPVPNLLFAHRLLSGKHAMSRQDRRLEISVSRLVHVPLIEHYCREDPGGLKISRDEVLRLQQLSRQLPFDKAMQSLTAGAPGKLYWTAECEYQQQHVRTESRDRSEPSFVQPMTLAIPPGHDAASSLEIIVSLWDEKVRSSHAHLHEYDCCDTCRMKRSARPAFLLALPRKLVVKARARSMFFVTRKAGSYRRWCQDSNACSHALLFACIARLKPLWVGAGARG